MQTNNCIANAHASVTASNSLDLVTLEKILGSTLLSHPTVAHASEGEREGGGTEKGASVPTQPCMGKGGGQGKHACICD